MHITEKMVKLLIGNDDKEKKKYLKSLYYTLCRSEDMMLQLAIEMFQKYKQLCPEKFELLTGYHDPRKVCDRLTNTAVYNFF